MRKILFSIILFCFFPVFVSASSSSLVKIGNNYYDSFEEAIEKASSDDVVTLINDVKLEDTMVIDKVVNIDLNGKTITANSKVFQVENGVLNVSGKGLIKETEPNYGAIMVVGSLDSDDKDYSVVNVSRDVSLEGWSGIFINRNYSSAHGVVVNFSGKIKAVSDTSGGEGIGIYVNGNIQHNDNAPVVNILDGAEIVSNGNGLYIAGYSTFNISKAYISGVESGIGIKAGNLNIDGATVECKGSDATPTDGYQNGIKASGTALQIESNNGYAGNIKIDIDDGEFVSEDSNSLYEYIGRGSESLVNSIDISGGRFLSKANKSVFLFSNSFKDKQGKFISGGEYSSDPSEYLKSGYNAVLDDGLYKVTKTTMKEVDGIGIRSGSGLGLKIVIISIVIIFGILTYFNRKKILNIFK